MKYLGIDFGTKNIGLALSDDNGSIAFPLKTIPAHDAMAQIQKTVHDEQIEEIVLGDPGQENAIYEQVISFKEKLEEIRPVKLEREFMTSFHTSLAEKHSRDDGRRHEQDRTKKDESAAALILQRFLDRKQT
jgi:putative Holliday junction resolvase